MTTDLISTEPDGESLELAHYAQRAYLEYALSVVKGRSQAHIVQHLDGGLELLHEGWALAFTQFNGLDAPVQRTADEKTLNAQVDLVCAKIKRQSKSSPIARLAAQIAHQDFQRTQGIYTPSHASELPKRRNGRKVSC